MARLGRIGTKIAVIWRYQLCPPQKPQLLKDASVTCLHEKSLSIFRPLQSLLDLRRTLLRP